MLSIVSRSLLVLVFTFTILTPVIAKETLSMSLSDEVDIDINVYPAKGDKIILWLACNEGREGVVTRSANVLNQQGIEVWLPDFLSAHFLPQGPSSIYKIPGTEVAAVINMISKKRPNKEIYLVAAGRASAPLLRGAAEWEKLPSNKKLKGAIMFYPRLNLLEIMPGKEPVYIESVGKASLPMIILEGERTPNRWGLPHLSRALKQASPSVSYSLLPKVRGYFYTRQKKTAAEEALSNKVHELILNNLSKFAK